MSQSYSTPSRQHQATWPIFVQSPAQNNARFQATMTTYHARTAIPISNASNLVVSQAKGEAPRSSMTAHPVYQFWTPPQRSASPDEIAWTQPLETEGDSTSTPSASSDEDDDESPAETSLALVPKQLASQTPALKKPTDSDLFSHSPAISNLSKILSPMANQQGGMHLVALRSPSVRYDKVIHGARSPATTVHLALPHASAARSVSKPPLPLPGSAKAMPRPQGVTAQPRPNTTEALKSPPVIGLDLALQPPADHRDSAMTPRSSMAVKTSSARPSLVVPVDIPKRMSTTASNASSQTIRKPSSAPTPSPISAGPPEPSTMTSNVFLNPTSAKVPNDTLQQPVHAPSSTSSSSTAVSITPSITITTTEPTAAAPPPRATEPPSEAILSERAEIRSRTLSSTNLREASKSDAPAPTQSRGPSPHSSLHSINLAEKELPVIPESSSPVAPTHRPGPTPIQPTIAVTDDETDVEVDEPTAPLRVVNVTSDFGLDSFASVPTTQAVPTPAPVNEGVTPPKANSIATAAVTSTPLPSRIRVESIARTENVQHEPSLTNMPPTSELSNTHTTVSNRHASLPPLPSGYAHQLSSRLNMPSNAARFSLNGPTPNAARPRPKLPPPNRTWVPKNLTVPAPLSQSPSPVTLTFPGTSSQPFPSQQPPLRQPLPGQNVHAPVPHHHQPQPQPYPQSHTQEQQPQQPQLQRQRQQQQPQQQHAMPRYSHGHSYSHPLPTNPMNSQQALAQPEPISSHHDYYSSDDDDPSKWAPYPEPSGSRRSSRSSRSSRSYNRNSIYGPHAESEEEDGGLLYPPPSISLPNLRPILQYPGDTEPITPAEGPSKKIKFAVPADGNDKPSQAAGGRRRIRRRSNSTSSIVRDPKTLPWSDLPDGSARRSGLITVPDPFGYDYADEGRYDAINRPDLVPADIRERYIRPDGGPRLPEYREMFSAKSNALRAAAEQESRARILGRRTRTPAVSVEMEEDIPITIPVCLRRPRATSEDGHGASSGARLRRRSRSRDRAADWAPPPTIPDPERPAFAQHYMPPSSSSLSLLPNAFEKMSRKFSKLRK